MSKRRHGKLSLNTEKLRKLNPVTLGRAVGGTLIRDTYLCETRLCPVIEPTLALLCTSDCEPTLLGGNTQTCKC